MFEKFREQKASRGSCRSVIAAISNPGGSSVGRSFKEWTARSTRPAARASSISLVKIPLPSPPLVPTIASGTSVILSPVVWMISISTSWPRARKRAEMWLACHRASCEPREPMRSFVEEWPLWLSSVMGRSVRASKSSCSMNRACFATGLAACLRFVLTLTFPICLRRRAFFFVVQIEQPSNYVNHRCRLRFAGRGLQRCNGCVHNFVDDAAGQGLDCHFLLRRQCTHAAAHAVDLGLADGLKMILQAHDGWDHIKRVQARFEAGFKVFHLAGDYGFGEFGLFAAVGDVAADRLLQIVDIVGKDAVELGHLRRHVPRHRDVDEKHRLVLAAGEELFSVLAAEDGMRRAG